MGQSAELYAGQHHTGRNRHECQANMMRAWKGKQYRHVAMGTGMPGDHGEVKYLAVQDDIEKDAVQGDITIVVLYFKTPSGLTLLMYSHATSGHGLGTMDVG